MKPNIWIFSIEPLETRYTCEWHLHFPKLLKDKFSNLANVIQVDGIQKNTVTTPGAFLNFSDTNYWKSSQLCKFLEHHNNGETTTTDHFIFTDAWNPTILQLKYMSDLLGYNWTFHGLWHAGSYDPQDFLGRQIGAKKWVRHTEKSFFHAFNHNYFATEFHIKMFLENLIEDGYKEENPWYEEDYKDYMSSGKIVQTGWPMEYFKDVLSPYQGMKKRDMILFPHRISSEKQINIFRDLAHWLPQYEFVVCQETQLTKQQYHTLLGEAKMVFSANLQETLGISWFEGAILGAIPLVPDRLSYSEMALDNFKYPSKWTENFDAYTVRRPDLVRQIQTLIDNYDTQVEKINEQVEVLNKKFFSSEVLLNNIQRALNG